MNNIHIPLDRMKLYRGKTIQWELAPDYEHYYKKSLKMLGNKWIFTNKQIEYSMNSDGFRMDEFSNINGDYILFLGCSNTVGVGLPLEDTYTYKISSHLNLNNVNLGICAATNHNILYLLSKVLESEHKPKYVIINWTSVTRQTYWYDGEMTNKAPRTVNSKKELNNLYEEFLLIRNKCSLDIFNDIKKQCELLCILANIPLYEITNFINVPIKNKYTDYRNDIDNIYKEDIEIVNLKYARDLSHPGIQINNDIYKDFIRSLDEKTNREN